MCVQGMVIPIDSFPFVFFCPPTHSQPAAGTPAAAAAANMYGGGMGGSQGMALPYSGAGSIASTLYTNPPAPTAYASQVGEGCV